MPTEKKKNKTERKKKIGYQYRVQPPIHKPPIHIPLMSEKTSSVRGKKSSHTKKLRKLREG